MKVTHDNINQFLYTPGKYFVIPDFQRPYSWDKANVISFIEDLESVMQGKKKHFFGSVVYINEGNNSTIIDGQQRATTVLLMLTALSHIAKDNKQSSSMSSEEIEDKYLYNKYDYATERNRIKLRTVTTDNKIFEEIFERTNYSEKSKDSKLYQAYAFFYEYFKDLVSLEQYVNALENFEIVTIALDSTDDNPQKIFESINSTGKPLTDGDKIRNFALMLNNTEARDVVLKKYWEKIETELTDINKDFITDFFKNFLTSFLQREVKLENVYAEFKRLFNEYIGEDQDDVSKLSGFYDEVVNYLDYYVFLKFVRNEGGYSAAIADKVFRLNFLKIETPFPFIMRILDSFNKGTIEEKELLQILKTLENYLARRIICNLTTAGLNKFFSTLHKEIEGLLTKNPDENYSNILNYLLTNRSGDLRMPKDSEIESAVHNNPFYTQKNVYINFILSSIDDQSKESRLLKQIANGDIQLSIEHIMPQTLNPSWKKSLGENFEEIHQQFLHTLPNLTLTAYNTKYSNNDFETKKTIENGFNDSPLIINQYIKEVQKWDLETLEKRKKWWLSQISKIWPIPRSTFAPKTQESEIIFTENDLIGEKIKAVSIFGEVVESSSWVEAFSLILVKFFSMEDNLYDYIVTDEFLYRYIKNSAEGLRSPLPLTGTTYFYESNLNNNYKRDVIDKLADHLEIDKTEIKAILDKSSKS